MYIIDNLSTYLRREKTDMEVDSNSPLAKMKKEKIIINSLTYLKICLF